MSTMIAITAAAQSPALAQRQRVTFRAVISTLLAMLRRDALVTVKQFHTSIVILLVQPAMLLLALGRIQTLVTPTPPPFVTILLPGILGSVMVTVSIQSVTMPLVIEFGYTREIEDRLLSPVPVWAVGAEKIFVGMVKALVCCALYFPLAWLILGPSLYHPNITQPWLFAAAILLTGLMMASLGLTLGTLIQSSQLNIMFSVLLVPMSFLGCVYFSWLKLSHAPVLQYLTLLDPQTYISEALRATLLPRMPHMDFRWIFAALLGWTILFALLGMRGFIRKTIR
jgi:ABC-2 type transport system permease protein